MPILLDQSIPPNLVRTLRDLFPDLETAYLHSLIRFSDTLLFEWARDLQYPAIVTASQALVRMVGRLGPPPKIIVLPRCDMPARSIELMIRRQADRIQCFLRSPESVLCVEPSIL